MALAIELFTEGSLNTFAKPTNVNTSARILCYDIRDLGLSLIHISGAATGEGTWNAKKRFPVGTRLARYQHQLSYARRERGEDDE